jgi:hypothetical protein
MKAGCLSAEGIKSMKLGNFKVIRADETLPDVIDASCNDELAVKTIVTDSFSNEEPAVDTIVTDASADEESAAYSSDEEPVAWYRLINYLYYN